MQKQAFRLPWLAQNDAFPPPHTAWGADSDAPGLLAAGGSLAVESLESAYSQGIFPWYSAGQPCLWWCPNPRMVLPVAQFKLHASLRKTIVRFSNTSGCEVRMDTAFAQVIQACAGRRGGQSKDASVQATDDSDPNFDANSVANNPPSAALHTWIQPEMVTAYTALHQAGLAHSVETWVQGNLVGGLYLVNLGRMVFGESMFSRQTDASKIALAALVAFCRSMGVPLIDCQQNTSHLHSLGAHEVPRQDFLDHLSFHVHQGPPAWPAGRFDPIYWQKIVTPCPASVAP